MGDLEMKGDPRNGLLSIIECSRIGDTLGMGEQGLGMQGCSGNVETKQETGTG